MEKKILELQKIIENHPEKITQLTDIELIQLNYLYDQQIQEIDTKLHKQKEFYKNLIKSIGKK